MANLKTKNKETGDLGEKIAVKHLKNKGFTIVEQNYWKKFGEIDIVARGTGNIVHFIEVKSVSYETRELLEWAVTNACTPGGETWRPEELVHQFKLNQIRKASESWIFANNWAGEIQIDVVTVRMVPREKYARVKYIENITI